MKILKPGSRSSSKFAAFAGAAVLFGAIATVRIFASGSFVSLEPETGTLAAGATAVAASGASGGQAAKFAAAAGGCPAFPAFPDAGCTGWQHTGVTLTPYTGPS